MTISKHITNEDELRRELLAMSNQHGGAWVAHVLPFGGPTILTQFPNPSSVPDDYLANTYSQQRGIAYKGQLRPYSKAAITREQNRCLGRE